MVFLSVELRRGRVDGGVVKLFVLTVGVSFTGVESLTDLPTLFLVPGSRRLRQLRCLRFWLREVTAPSVVPRRL